jgi:putative tryptophan/tyrosine transport system substrate-binding protein
MTEPPSPLTMLLSRHTRRRDFIAGLGGMTAAWPMAARAQQQPALPVIGFLYPQSAEGSKFAVVPFQQGLREAGLIEGQNVAVEYRFADNQLDRLRMQTADLVRRQVAVIVAHANAAAVVAKAATATIPIVFSVGGDPVALGLVASLNRPGGNATGHATMQALLVAKQLELVRELVPKATLIGFLVDPTNPNTESETREMLVAGRAINQQVLVQSVRDDADLENSFATLGQQRASAVVVGNGAFFGSRRDSLIALAARHALPAIYPLREYAVAGGLMSYGSTLSHAYHQIGIFVREILRGEKPANLPVQQATKVELTINLETAKALGLTFPLTLLGRADEVIE